MQIISMDALSGREEDLRHLLLDSLDPQAHAAEFSQMLAEGASTTAAFSSDGQMVAAIQFRFDPFDSAVLRRRSGHLTHWHSRSAHASAEVLRAAVLEAQGRGVEYLVTRSSAANFGRCTILQRAGFQFIDGIITFRSELVSRTGPADKAKREASTRPATDSDLQHLLAIADESFHNTRFHNDDALPQDTALRAYREWVTNSLNGYAEYFHVATEDGAPVAFITAKRQGTRCQVGLVATATAHRNRGLARCLVEECAEWARVSDCKELVVGTQLGNIAAGRVYESAGCRITETSLTFRWIPPCT